MRAEDRGKAGFWVRKALQKLTACERRREREYMRLVGERKSERNSFGTKS